MTLAQLRSYVKSRLVSGTSVSDAMIDQHLNEAYREVSRPFTADIVYRDSTSLATVAGQRLYTLNSDVSVLKRLYLMGSNGEEKRLEVITEDKVSLPYEDGEPVRYYLAGSTVVSGVLRQQIGLDPVPTTSYAGLRLVQEYEPVPPALFMNDDVPAWVPEEWHPLIAVRAMTLVAGVDEDWDVKRAWQEEFTSGFSEMVWKQMERRFEVEYPALSGGLAWSR